MRLSQGIDTAANHGLWMSDGTAAGTHELTGITGASAGGLNPGDFTVFNGEALFAANNTAGATGLWVTNGTAVGTHELTGISGAYTGYPGGASGFG
jgi:ELWxxDGT repeat protein